MSRRSIIAGIIALLSIVLLLAAWQHRYDVKNSISAAVWSRGGNYHGSGAKSSSGGMKIEWYEVHSEATHRTLQQVAFIPPGGSRGRPVVFFLHGRGGHPGGYGQQIATAFSRYGDQAPVVVQIAGGDHSYYHNRADGRWGDYVTDEAIPAAVKRFHVDRNRMAIGGISMGGFGALDIAEHSRGRFCAVGGHSAALWSSGGQSAPGAFDSAEDFSRHDVISDAARHPERFRHMRIWLDGGNADPFLPGKHALVRALRSNDVAVSAHTWSGAHTGTYWRAHFDDYMRFYVRSLASCRN